jgi:hypothetical protein
MSCKLSWIMGKAANVLENHAELESMAISGRQAVRSEE